MDILNSRFVTLDQVNEGFDALDQGEVARQIMAEHNITINDLNRFAAPKLDALQRPVNVHFTPEGSRALGERVTETIRDALPRRRQ